MKINELIYQTPEMTEEKLLEFISSKLKFIRRDLLNRISQLHKYELNESQAILAEWDLIQDKKSLLTRSQRDFISGLVSASLIEMTKGYEGDK